MKRLWSKLLFSLGVGLSLSQGLNLAVAAENPLNQVALPVSDRSASAYNQAVINAYAQLMKSLSGNPAIMTTPQVMTASREANQFVSSYRYEQRLDPISQKEGLWLVLDFNQHALNKLLSAAGQPTLGKARPSTLLIFLRQDGDQGHFLSTGDQLSLNAQINAAAAARHLPIELSLGDLEDQEDLKWQPDGNLSDDSLVQFHQRYGKESILILRWESGPGAETIRALAWIGQQHWEWSVQAASLEAALAESFDHWLANLAEAYAVVKSPRSTQFLSLELVGIRELAGYSVAIKTLKSYPMVNHLQVTEINPDHLRVCVSIHGDVEALQRALQSDKSLIPAYTLLQDRKNG